MGTVQMFLTGLVFDLALILHKYTSATKKYYQSSKTGDPNTQ